MSNQLVNVREAFVAREGYYFIDVDYSQIEFRLSAALAGEKPLITGFLKGNDYYRMVYSAMNGGMPVDQVTKVQRALGKILALGQNYGQEEYGLAKKLRCTVDLARQYMDQYWSGLPATKRAKDAALQRALQDGGVRTWFQRWRPLPELFLKGATKQEQKIRKKAVRSVWNTIVQGTAADWLKIAMVRSGRALANFDAHMLLTVHDELLFEVSCKESLLEVSRVIREAMEFKVKGLPVGHTELYPDGFFVPTNVKYGFDWGNLFSLDDTVDAQGQIKRHKETNEELIGFRTFCQRQGLELNWDVPTEPREYTFLAPPNTDVIVQIPERKTLVATEPKATMVSSLSGKHPIDQLCDVLDMLSGKGPVTPPPTSTRQLDLPGTTASTVLADVTAAAVQLDAATTVPEVKAALALVEQVVTTVEQTLASSNGTNGHQPPPEVTAVSEQTDYKYPCVVVKPGADITSKDLDLFKKVLERFAGDHWVYLDYKDRLIEAGEKFKVKPDGNLFVYLKRVFGDKTSHELYDGKGRAAKGRVNFV